MCTFRWPTLYIEMHFYHIFFDVIDQLSIGQKIKKMLWNKHDLPSWWSGKSGIRNNCKSEEILKFHIDKVPVFHCLMKKFKSIKFYQKKGLSRSCYSSTWEYHFIFIVRKCNFFVNNIDKAFTWDVRTLDFLDLALKLSLPQLFL